jgi:hypothetical protein
MVGSWSLHTKEVAKKALRALRYESRRKRRRRWRVEVDYRWLVHFLYFKRLYELIQNVEGDIVECGVGAGHTFFKLCCLSAMEGKCRDVWGFDSFEGFPEPSEEDKSPRNPQKGEWNVATEDDIKQLLRRRGLEETFVNNHVKLSKGFFEESLHAYNRERIAFLHLDVDLYQSYKVTLERFWPKVSAGGVVLFDEYRNPGVSEAFPGAAKAIDEFFGNLRSQIQYDQQASRFFIVK